MRFTCVNLKSTLKTKYFFLPLKLVRKEKKNLQLLSSFLIKQFTVNFYVSLFPFQKKKKSSIFQLTTISCPRLPNNQATSPLIYFANSPIPLAISIRFKKFYRISTFLQILHLNVGSWGLREWKTNEREREHTRVSKRINFWVNCTSHP